MQYTLDIQSYHLMLGMLGMFSLGPVMTSCEFRWDCKQAHRFSLAKTIKRYGRNRYKYILYTYHNKLIVVVKYIYIYRINYIYHMKWIGPLSPQKNICCKVCATSVGRWCPSTLALQSLAANSKRWRENTRGFTFFFEALKMDHLFS